MDGMFFESNATADILDAGFAGKYSGIQSGGLVHFTTTAATNQVIGGFCTKITIDSGATAISLLLVAIARTADGGLITDNGTATLKLAYSANGGFLSGLIPQSLGVGPVTTQLGRLHVAGVAEVTVDGDYDTLTIDHPNDFASQAENRINFTEHALVLARIAHFFEGGTSYGLKFYTTANSNVSSPNAAPALTLDGDQNASFMGTVTTGLFQSFSGPGGLLTINGSGVIAPSNQIHHVAGAGPLKTITVPSSFTTGAIYLIPDATWSYDLTGNIGLAGTAVIGKVIVFVYDGSKWYPSTVA